MHSVPNPQQEPGEVPAPALMGPPSTYISHSAVKAFQSFNTPTPYLNPLLVPPPSCCPSRWATYIFPW